MDDIIVFILTLLFIAAGIFGQIKKRPLPPETGDQEPSQGEKFWETIVEDEESMGVSEHHRPAEKIAVEDRFHTAKGMMKRDVFKKPSQSTAEKAVAKVIKKERFPLKKAIIYSEILNRKYF